MLTEPLIERLQTLRLPGMATALEQPCTSSDRTQMSVEDPLGLMIEFTPERRPPLRTSLTSSLFPHYLPAGRGRGLASASLRPIAHLAPSSHICCISGRSQLLNM